MPVGARRLASRVAEARALDSYSYLGYVPWYLASPDLLLLPFNVQSIKRQSIIKY